MRRVRFGVRLVGALAAGILLRGTALPQHVTAPFDLQGPRIDMRVTRKGKTLPIAETPNLEPGDRVWVHPDLPANQSTHYLMVIAFLRGATNPPPEKWFIKAETWTKPVSEEGLVFTVPEGAQQTLLFLAPETSGDFKTLKSAVKGRPGAFVRSSQDLNQASLDRSRVETYLAAVRKTSDTDPSKLQETSALLARSLNLKVNQACFERPAAEQSQCLTQESDQMVLNDGHSQSMVSALTNGPGSDLVTQLSYTPTAGAGYYSSYVGAIVDVVRLFDNFHTAEYQYIPALNFPQADALDLKLNNPPSFHNPKSVIVVALPATQAAVDPPMRPLDPKAVYCLSGTSTVLPAGGAPLVYSTAYAHALQLKVTEPDGKSLELPTHADAAKGGFVVDAGAISPGSLPAHVAGEIQGQWGFQPLQGPTFALATPHATQWTAPSADAMALVVGRQDTLHLRGDAAACVGGVMLRDTAGKEHKADYKLTNPDELEIKMPLTDAAPGALTLLVEQRGLAKPDEVALHSYAEAAHLDGFAIHAGDSGGVLTGTRLDEVAGLAWDGKQFAPGTLSRAGDKDVLELNAGSGTGPVSANAKGAAKITLKDGRVMDLSIDAEAPRPEVALTSKDAQAAEAGESAAAIHLEDPSELPLGGKVSFVLKAVTPAEFPRTERVEIASADGTLHTTLTMADGSLQLQDASTMLGTFDPLKSFGPSAFGPLQLRPVDATGAKGDWRPLGTLVRLPVLMGLRCAKPASAPPVTAGGASQVAGDPAQTAAQCTLSGSNLFLVEAVSTDAAFTNSVPVPDGFLGTTLTVPKPSGGPLYIRLRDDPAVANTVVMPVGGAQARVRADTPVRRPGE